jgi:hypothetical protein
MFSLTQVYTATAYGLGIVRYDSQHISGGIRTNTDIVVPGSHIEMYLQYLVPSIIQISRPEVCSDIKSVVWPALVSSRIEVERTLLTTFIGLVVNMYVMKVSVNGTQWY